MKISDIKIFFRLLAVVICGAIGLIALGLYSSIQSYDLIIKERQLKAKTQIENVSSLIKSHAERAEEFGGTEGAQKAVMQAIKDIRYDGDQYFWINDINGIMVMHPLNEKLIGKNIIEVKDARGNKVFADIINLVKKDGAGYYRYWWQTKNDPEPREKISYVQGYKDWGWIVGTGNYIDDVQVTFKGFAISLIIAGVIILGGTLLVALLITRTVTRPLATMTEVMNKIIGGDYDVETGMSARKDEFGEMAKAVDVFRANGLEKLRLEQEQVEAARRAEEERRNTLNQLAESFEQSVGNISNAVSDASTNIQSCSNNLLGAVGVTRNKSTEVNSASQTASESVQAVASAAQQLSTSISEISSQVAQSSQMADAAVTQAETTMETVSSLVEAANRIGEVVQLINDIADQTNMLALNATIEAARAGDSGKGFAVVASEVKNLANQTAKATEEIASQIGAVQHSSEEAANAIKDISGSIVKINEVSAAVAAAVEEQGAATSEIANSADLASDGTSNVNTNIVEVVTAVEQTDSETKVLLTTSGDLSQQAANLNTAMSDFVAKIRQG